MNYTLRKLNCKVLVGGAFAIVLSALFVVSAYASNYTVRKIPSFWFDDKFVFYAENVSPRSSSLDSVIIGYDDLADLVYYCNDHGLSASLYYNSAKNVYVGFLNDTGFKITELSISSVYGLLCNSAGKIYVAEKQASGGDTITNNTYNYNHTVINPSSPGSTRTPVSNTAPTYWEVIDTLKAIYTKVDFTNQYLSIVCDWLNFQSGLLIDVVHSLERSIAPALEAVNNNLIVLKDGTVTGLNNLHEDLTFNSDVLLTQLNVQNAIYSSVAGLGSRLDTLIINSNTLIANTAGIGSRLDSIINNGAVQVNTSSIDARLDKLISMYSKVNSVVLDTAAVNGGQITGAVGGALQDVVIYGRTRRENFQLTAAVPGLSVNGAPASFGDAMLRAVWFTGTVPTYITDDATLSAGLWKSGSTNYVSDTYNVATGEHIQRVNTVVLTGEEAWSMAARAGDANIFYTSFPGQRLAAQSSRYSYIAPSTAFTQGSANVDDLAGSFTSYANALRFVAKVSSVDNWKAYLRNQVAAGTPVTVYWIPDPATDGTGTVSSWYADSATITIPEGDSTITADGLRVTAKYETYDSYTKTADIIAAINNIPPYDDSGLIAAITGMTTPTVTTDLTEVTSRLDLILAELQSTSGSATCEHTYAQHMEQDADCTLPGLMISTCSKCGDSYSEIVDPLGHDWVLSSHVDAVTDPDTGEETASAYDVYTCSRCDRTYEDHTGDGAPNEDYSNTSISKLVVQVFSKLGTFAGKLIGFFVHLLDKALTSVDNVISKFNDYTAQITGFGGSYTTWLTGFWGIIPAELQIALTFSVICMALGAVGKRLLFS